MYFHLTLLCLLYSFTQAQQYLRVGFEPIHIDSLSISSFAVSHHHVCALGTLYNNTQSTTVYCQNNPHSSFYPLSTPFTVNHLALDGHTMCLLDDHHHIHCTRLSFPLYFVTLPGLFLHMDMDHQRLCGVTLHHQVVCTLQTGSNYGSWFPISCPEPLVSVSVYKERLCGLNRQGYAFCTDSLYSPDWHRISTFAFDQLDTKHDLTCGVSHHHIYCLLSGQWIQHDATFPALQVSIKRNNMIALDVHYGLFHTIQPIQTHTMTSVWKTLQADMHLNSLLEW